MKLEINKLTLCDQIANALRSQIEDDQFPDGKLPKEEALAKELGLSRGTVRAAMALLEEEDLIVRIKKKGTFIKGANYAFQQLKKLKKLNLYYFGTYKSFKNSNKPGFFGYVYNAIIAEANRNDFKINNIVIENIDSLNKYLEIESDGNLIFGIGNKKIIQAIADTGKPCVLIDHLHKNLTCVNIDSYQGSSEAIKYLYGRGHRKFIYIDYKNNTLNIERSNGVMDTLSALGVNNKDIIRVFSKSGFEGGYKSIQELISDGILKKKYTAIVTYSSVMASGALKAFQDNQINIPEKFSLISSGNISDIDKPILSTIDFDLNHLGKMAIDQISHIISGTTSTLPNTPVRGFVVDRGSIRDLR
ncbi:MAG: hypothetical protein COA79_25810 [Planctomycetota bacterium]|nr:MAG: hypothetical protein COA79_25810 [Planctomycetota bacterium]